MCEGIRNKQIITLGCSTHFLNRLGYVKEASDRKRSH